MSEIHRADPHARRVAVAIVGFGTLIGVVLLAVGRRCRPEFEAWLEQDVSARLTLVVVGVTAVATGPLLGLTAYLWHLGLRVRRSERFPLQGFRVIRDTPVMTGAPASRRGRLIQLYAIVLGVAALFLPFVMWRIATMLGSGVA